MLSQIFIRASTIRNFATPPLLSFVIITSLLCHPDRREGSPPSKER